MEFSGLRESWASCSPRGRYGWAENRASHFVGDPDRCARGGTCLAKRHIAGRSDWWSTRWGRSRGGGMTSMVSGPALSAAQLDAELLEDKLRVPRPGLAVLPRRRIGDLIEAGVSRRVTLVTGPPGCGKTVAAAQWGAAEPGRRRAASG